MAVYGFNSVTKVMKNSLNLLRAGKMLRSDGAAMLVEQWAPFSVDGGELEVEFEDPIVEASSHIIPVSLRVQPFQRAFFGELFDFSLAVPSSRFLVET